jgi:hypothetical protein
MKTLIIERSLTFTALATLIFLGALLNFKEQKKIEDSKLPEYVEQNKYFQKWITNHKNSGIELEADEFRLFEENEVYNTARLIVFPVSDSLHNNAYKQLLNTYTNIKDARFSPNKAQIVDFRHEIRTGLSMNEYKPYELLYVGLRKDRIIENKLLECSRDALCYIDRAYFVTDDIVVASTFTQNNEVPGKIFVPCSYEEKCEYTVTVYVMNIAANSSLVYKAPPLELRLSEKIEGF